MQDYSGSIGIFLRPNCRLKTYEVPCTAREIIAEVGALRSMSIGCESGSRSVVEGGKDVVDTQVLESEIMNTSRVPVERLLRLDSHEPLQLLAIKDADGPPQVRGAMAIPCCVDSRTDCESRLAQ